MDVRLTQALRRDADEPGLGAHVLDVASPAVAHAALQAADELEDRLGERAAVGHAPLDAFGHELALLVDIGLEIAVPAALPHGANRAHAAIDLVAAALIKDDLAWGF